MGKDELKPKPFVAIEFDTVSAINSVLMSNLLKNSNHRVLSEADDGQIYYIFAVSNENEETEYKNEDTGEKHTYLSLAKKVQANLAEQYRLAQEANSKVQIPYLGASQITVNYGKSTALLSNARLISTNNGWTLVGNLTYKTSSVGAIVKPVVLAPKKEKKEEEATAEMKLETKEIAGL